MILIKISIEFVSLLTSWRSSLENHKQELENLNFPYLFPISEDSEINVYRSYDEKLKKVPGD